MPTLITDHSISIHVRLSEYLMDDLNGELGSQLQLSHDLNHLLLGDVTIPVLWKSEAIKFF